MPKVYTGATSYGNLNECPDASNVMFPFVTDVPITGFSKGQLEIISKNLTLIPH
jgi:hypothetical protein